MAILESVMELLSWKVLSMPLTRAILGIYKMGSMPGFASIAQLVDSVCETARDYYHPRLFDKIVP